MNSTHIISQDVFDKIRSRFTNLEMGDESGEVTTDPKEARFFDFDFVVEGNNLGRVSISINETGALKLFYSQGILEDSDNFIHQLWYDFLREMRMFAKRRLLRFDTRDITKSNLNKDDFQYLANPGSKDNNMNMNESAKFEGSKMTSRRVLEKAVLIAKHHTPISDESRGARSRKNNIKALYIENAEGERYKFPFIYIAGAKAMQRHVANGGRPYDEVGNHIVKMCENIAQLTAFKRHINSDGMNQEVNEIIEKSNAKLVALRRQMESICGQAGYENWTSGAGELGPVGGDGLELDQATMENYKSKFTVNSFKEDLAQYFPLIHSIMQEAGTVDLEDYVSEDNDTEYCDACDRPEEKCVCDDTKESINFETFENWADRIAEGLLGMDQLGELDGLLKQGLTLDTDGESAIQALQGIGIHNDDLEDALRGLAKANPGADPKDTILAWLAKDDPEAAKELGYQSDEPDLDAEEPDLDAEEPAPEVGAEKLPAGEDAVDGDDEKKEIKKSATPREVAEMVFTMYNRNHKEQGLGPFPKGEEGVITHVMKELGEAAGKMAEELVNYLSPGHKKTEGKLGATLGGLAGAVATKTPAGAMAGADIGSDIQDKLGEAVEDRTSYQVARYMFDKGIRYSPENEKHIISKMDDAMKKLGMNHKQIYHHLSYEEDFIPDTLSELQGMESALDELATGNPAPEVTDDLDEVMRLAGMQQEGLKDVAKKVGGAVKAGAKAVGKAITGPDDDELLSRLEKETGGKRPNAYNKPKNEDVDVILKLAGMAK
jgi:hypothetical protein